MITSVSLQYAKALFDLALLNHQENEYYDTLKVVNLAIAANQEFYQIMKHPTITKEERKKIINTMFQDKMANELLYFLNVLIDNDRFDELNNIVESYQYYLDELKMETSATICTKYELSSMEKTTLVHQLENYFHKKLKVDFQLDQQMIGGIIIRVNDQIIDASLLNELIYLKNELKKGW